MLGWPEVLLIFAVLLLVMGPSKLPEMAKALGTAMREFQHAQTTLETTAQNLDTQMNTAINTLPPLSQPALMSPTSQAPMLEVDQSSPIPTSVGSVPVMISAAEDEQTKRLYDVAKTMGIATEGKTVEQLHNEIVKALGGQENEKEVK